MVRRLVESEFEKRKKKWRERIEKEAQLPPLIIVEEEVEWAKETTDSHKGFWCPYGRHPLFCDGYKCENKEYDQCLEFLKANMLLHKVEKGEIRVQWRTQTLRL
jgi:hypothetical protein